METCPWLSMASLPAAAGAGAWWEIKGAGKAATWGSVQFGECGDGTLPQAPEPNLSCLGMPSLSTVLVLAGNCITLCPNSTL